MTHSPTMTANHTTRTRARANHQKDPKQARATERKSLPDQIAKYQNPLHLICSQSQALHPLVRTSSVSIHLSVVTATEKACLVLKSSNGSRNCLVTKVHSTRLDGHCNENQTLDLFTTTMKANMHQQIDSTKITNNHSLRHKGGNPGRWNAHTAANPSYIVPAYAGKNKKLN